jgi:ABC-type multidrug transport system fused ATPase/permease subunit
MKFLNDSLLILEKDGRRQFWKLCGFRSLASLADLFAVAVVAFVGQLVVESSDGSEPRGITKKILNTLRIEDNSIQFQISVLISVAVCVFVVKASLSVFITARTFKFLAEQEVRAGRKFSTYVMTDSLPSMRQVPSQVYSHSLSQGLAAAIQRVLGFYSIFISESFMLLTMTFLFIALEPLTAIALIGYFALVGLILHKLVSGPAENLGKIVAESTAITTRTIQESLKGYREFFVAGKQSYSIDKYVETKGISAHETAGVLTLASAPRHIVDTALLVGIALACGINFLTSDLAEALRSIGFVLIAGTRIAPSLLSAQGAMAAIGQAGGESEHTYALNREILRNNSNRGPISSDEAMSSQLFFDIEIDSLSFAYPNSSKNALNNISLSIQKGEFIGIVGASGSGKSTLADLLLGVIPCHGRIKIGGFQPSQFVRHFPGFLGYVPQETFLMRGSIAENVALGFQSSEIDETRVMICLDEVGLSSLVSDLPAGVRSAVGEDGDQFSGGQRQRIGIARALYFKPRLLVFDESTSALDVESERAISALINRLKGEVTVIMIAHRLNSIQNADKIFLLEDGRIVNEGTFAEVVIANSSFAEQAKHFGITFD